MFYPTIIWLLFFVIHMVSTNTGNLVLRDLGEKEYSLIKGKKLKYKNVKKE